MKPPASPAHLCPPSPTRPAQAACLRNRTGPGCRTCWWALEAQAQGTLKRQGRARPSRYHPPQTCSEPYSPRAEARAVLALEAPPLPSAEPGPRPSQRLKGRPRARRSADPTRLVGPCSRTWVRPPLPRLPPTTGPCPPLAKAERSTKALRRPFPLPRLPRSSLMAPPLPKPSASVQGPPSRSETPPRLPADPSSDLSLRREARRAAKERRRMAADRRARTANARGWSRKRVRRGGSWPRRRLA